MRNNTDYFGIGPNAGYSVMGNITECSLITISTKCPCIDSNRGCSGVGLIEDVLLCGLMHNVLV
jgi:hypothetical protein